MKKLVFCLAVLLYVACNIEPNGVGNGEIEVSNTNLMFPAKAFYDEVSITTDASWKIAVAADWLSVSQKQGKGNETVTFVVEKNTGEYARSTQVKIYTKTSSQTVNVLQFSPTGDYKNDDVPTEYGNVTTENGAIKAAFSIGENKKAYFSHGNLQYQASTGIWRFAENQWNVVGDEQFGNVYENGVKCDNALISSTYSGWIDLFGYGTSGYKGRSIAYQPYSISRDIRHYNVSIDELLELSGEDVNSDWGVYNKISNGGNATNMWRTPTVDEFDYLFYKRPNAEEKASPANVAGTKGLIVLPDNCTFDLENMNLTFSENEWAVMESYGAVFFPITGGRDSTFVDFVDSKWMGDDRPYFGYYWLASPSDFSCRSFVISHCAPVFLGFRTSCYGTAVRLIQDVK